MAVDGRSTLRSLAVLAEIAKEGSLLQELSSLWEKKGARITEQLAGDTEPRLLTVEAKLTAQALRGLLDQEKQLEDSPRSGKLPSDSSGVVSVYLDGVFDVIHLGHFNAIRQARQLGDQLVVGINNDESVAKVKGTMPIYTMEERAELLRGCKWVDRVIPSAPYDTTLAILDSFGCDYCAHGDDIVYNAAGGDPYGELKAAGRMLIFKRSEGVSSSSLVNQLLQLTLDEVTPEVYVEVSEPQPLRRWITSQFVDSSEAQSPSYQSTVASSPTVSPARFDNAVESPTISNGTTSTCNKITTPMSEKPLEIPSVSKGAQLKMPPVDSSAQLLISTCRLNRFVGTPKLRRPGDKVVYADGSFDVFNVGHLRFLEKAKELGDFLIVGIHDDATVREIRGPKYPIVNMMERSLCVLAMRVTDDVIVGAPRVVSEFLINSFHVDVVAIGKRRDPYVTTDDSLAVPRRMGILREIDTDVPTTTNDVMRRILSRKGEVSAAISKRISKESNFYATIGVKMRPVEI